MDIRAKLHDPTMKQKLRAGFEAYIIIAIYFWVALGSFTIYRRLVLAETGISYLHYGIALVEALIIAKVVLIGRVFGYGRRFEDAPLALPVLYKSVMFALLVLGFAVVEHLVSAWYHQKGVQGVFESIAAVKLTEVGARVLLLTVTLVPFFAFFEVARVLGSDRMRALFITRREEAEVTG